MEYKDNSYHQMNKDKINEDETKEKKIKKIKKMMKKNTTLI